jgi:VWFA-related protein
MFQRRTVSLLILVSCFPLLHSQTGQIAESANVTFKSKVRAVLVDVVVTDQNNQPVTGLQKEDFQVFERSELFEQGKPQTITSFEEHKGRPSSPANQRPPLPPNVYTNRPLIPPADAVNVLLFDSLNTSPGDQSSVYAQMVSYLKTLEPGPRLAIFALSSRLRLVEGFTADPQVLLAALNHVNFGGTPWPSPALSTMAEENMHQRMLGAMADTHASASAVGAFQVLQAEMKGTQTAAQTSMTLEALQQLSRYLSGFPGRKNLIWFSGSFPKIDLRATNDPADHGVDTHGVDDRGVAKEAEKTVNGLASAQVAIYPVGAPGLDTDSLYEASQVSARAAATSALDQSPDIKGQNQSLQGDNISRYSNQKEMDDLATNTGGRAFYNTNGLKEALGEVINQGAHYYSISYSPTDKKTIGRYRHIEVKLRKRHYTLAYRHGYFEDDERQPKPADHKADTDALQRLMARGIPESTQILYHVRVLPSRLEPMADAPVVGDNKDVRGPFTRYGADFVIPIDDLNFEITPDGVRHGNVELALVAYDHEGKPLNWLFRSIRTSLKPELYTSVQKTGAQFHQEIDVPKGEFYLRTGIYDTESDTSGTLEIALGKLDGGKSAPSNGTSTALNGGASRPSNSSTAEMMPGSDRSQPSPPPPSNEASKSVGTSIDRPVVDQSVPQPPASISGDGASREFAELQSDADINTYCSTVAGTHENSQALTKVCAFALSMRKKLPDIICDREMERHWTVFQSLSAVQGTLATNMDNRADVVTATVSYREGQEYYNDVRINGKPVDARTPELSGTWSDGEFALILAGMFLPSSKAEFHFQKETKSGKVLVFKFHVTAQNNKSYSLHSENKAWLPEYQGQLWIDKQSLQLLRLERETAYMRKEPITHVKTTIDYADLNLGDGSKLVLPTHADVSICSPPVGGNSDSCSRNIIKFTNWHKFRATTHVVTNPTN